MAAKEIVRVRGTASPRDRFGDPAGAQPNPWRELPNCYVIPRTAEDYEQRGPIIVAGFQVIAPRGSAVNATDEAEVRGEVYQIEGSVADYGKKVIFFVNRIA